jgi:ATP-dependent DNA helicase RecG
MKSVIFAVKKYMMLDAREIKHFMQAGEGYNVDFKRSVPSKVREITEEVCSFANSAGGYVIIGIDDKNQLLGVTVDNSKRSAIQGSIGEVSPALHFEMYPVEVDEKEVWVIDIPSGNHKPYVFSGAIYVREGANCQKLTTAEEIRDFFQQSDRIYFDSIPCAGIDFLKNVDENNWREFKTAAKLTPDIPDEQIFDNLQLYDENGVIKRGGILFFGQKPEKLFFHCVVRCVLFKGTDKVYIIDDKTYGGSLPQQYKQAMEWLQSKLQISYLIEGTGPREEIWEIPLSVFKEAIINALSHRDYYEQGAFTTIEMFDDRVEISNPGGLLSVVAKNFGRKSLTRNPLIFGLFTRMHLVERIASGIPRMKADMKAAGLPEPEFQTEGMFTVIFYRTKEVASPQTVSDLVVGIKHADKILELIHENPKITAVEIAQSLDLSLRTVKRTISLLLTNEIIERKGSKKIGEWIILSE